MAVDQQTLVRTLVADRARLLAYIWAIVRDDDLAEDVYQEVAVSAVSKLHEVGDESHLARWLRQAARFRSLDALRRRSSDRLVFDPSVLDALESDWDARSTDAAGGGIDEARDRRVALRACVKALSPYAQRLIELRYAQNLTGERLASAVDRSMNTVYTALSRAHRALADCIRTRVSGDAGAGNAAASEAADA